MSEGDNGCGNSSSLMLSTVIDAAPTARQKPGRLTFLNWTALTFARCAYKFQPRNMHYVNSFIVVAQSCREISARTKDAVFYGLWWIRRAVRVTSSLSFLNTISSALNAYTAGRDLISSGTSRDRNWPSLRSPEKVRFSTTILPRSMTSDGQAARSRPSHGV
jgi:hypothetical protein